jgi:hypothetical protein
MPHGGRDFPRAHVPSCPAAGEDALPHPSRATLLRSPSTMRLGTETKSRRVCQRTAGGADGSAPTAIVANSAAE